MVGDKKMGIGRSGKEGTEVEDERGKGNEGGNSILR